MANFQRPTPLIIRNNETYQLVMSFMDRTGAAFDFTNFSFKMQIRDANNTSGNLLYPLTNSNLSITAGEDPTQGLSNSSTGGRRKQ